MNFPSLIEYQKSNGAQKRTLQERFVATLFTGLHFASNFEELTDRTRKIVNALVDAGYHLYLLDEDGESMVAYGGAISEMGSITIQVYWDDEEHSSVACTFTDGEESVVLAQSQPGEVVKVEL